MDRCRAAQPSRGILVAMVLRIDPRYPLVWRSPSTLQIGASVPRVVFAELNEVDERLIAALSVGVTKPGLTVIARSCGADDSAVPAILGTLAPVLAPVRQPRTPEVTVVGTGVTALRIAEALGGAGVHVRTVQGGQSVGDGPCDLAVAIGHYVLDPELHGLWLRRDIPHLSVVYSDTGASISQLVEPGSGPCLYCLQRRRTEADPAWPAISAQLWGQACTTETALLASEVAGIVGRTVLARLGRRRAASAHFSTQIDVQTGEVSRERQLPHPDCGCTGIAAATAAARPGSGWPDAGRRGIPRRSSSRTPPT